MSALANIEFTWELFANIFTISNIAITNFAMKVKPCFVSFINWQRFHCTFCCTLFLKFSIDGMLDLEIIPPLTFFYSNPNRQSFVYKILLYLLCFSMILSEF